MNERIHQIAEQVYGSAATAQERKFAEAIVRECAGIALKSGSVTNKPTLAVAEADRIYHKIKEHFGIE